MSTPYSATTSETTPLQIGQFPSLIPQPQRPATIPEEDGEGGAAGAGTAELSQASAQQLTQRGMPPRR